MSAEQAATYFLRIRGKVMGPFPFQQLQSLRDRGRLQPDHQVSTDRRQWKPAAQVKGLFAEHHSKEGVTVESISHGPTTTEAAVESGPPDEQWYYTNGDQQRGPVAFDRLQALADAGRITPETLVWRDGLGDWQAAESIPGLLSSAAIRGGTATGKARDRYREVASNRFWNGVLNLVRKQITQDDLETICQVLIQAGGYAVAAAMLACPAFLFVLAVKADSIQIAFYALAAFFGLAVLKYVAQRMSQAAHALVQASPNRLSSSAFPDTTGLVLLLAGAGLGATLTLWGVQADGLRETVIYVAIAAYCLVTFGYAACVCLHPTWLNIDCSARIRAGEEGVGVAAFLLKLCLRFAPVQFGVGAVIATLGFLAALMMLIVGDEWLPHAIALASASGMMIVQAGLVPLFFYLLMISVSTFLDLTQSIMLIPVKLDDLAAARDSPDATPP